MNEDDRKRLHELLDYAIDHDEDFVIAQFAQMNLDFHIKREILTMHIKKLVENA